MTRFIARSSAHWKDSPFLLSFRDVPERSDSVTTVYFWVVLDYCAGPSVNRPEFSLPQSVDHRELAIRPQVQAGGKKVMWQGDVGVWATSSWDLLVPSVPARAQYHIYHLDLMMQCCRACPDLRLVGQTTPRS